ncbi:hypothetical protein PENVUL_c001G02876 [Penicillium vulpinum]|uniref:Uncharacterized protein n=1 Tax=Penicillium vulpinum TaxID=29845 RepID=A0A1V6SDE3_9EURO|nr:hypothetical protein PENVUL_c001G02876 [Penicillium vulpinum]
MATKLAEGQDAQVSAPSPNSEPRSEILDLEKEERDLAVLAR